MKLRTVLLLLAVTLLTALPLWLIREPDPAGELFDGSDARGQQVISELAPDYRPWFESLLTPPGKEIESLLFALQAALGAGIIGYWLGSSVTRDKMRREAERRAADKDNDAH